LIQFCGNNLKFFGEKLHDSARFICGVPLRTPIGALFGDLNWYPFKARALNQAVCFWTRVTKMDDSLLVRQAMYVQKDLLRCSKPIKCWLSRLRDALCLYPVGARCWNVWQNAVNFRVDCVRVIPPSCPAEKPQLVKWEFEIFEDIIKVENQNWLSDILAIRKDEVKYAVSDNLINTMPVDKHIREIHSENNNKLRTYSLFKSERVDMERYLICVTSVSKRQALSRFRMGVSVLRVETGRYESNGINGTRGIPIQMRVCKCCDLCKVEDEIHFLLECSLYHTF